MECPRYVVSMGLDSKIARGLIEADPVEVTHEADKVPRIRELRRTVLGDGAALLLTARSDERELDPAGWWESKKKSEKPET